MNTTRTRPCSPPPSSSSPGLPVRLRRCRRPAPTTRPPTAPSSSTPDDTTGTGTLALTADGSVAAKCAMPSAETLATFDTAFAGTVTSLDGGTATLSVDQWYAGDEAATVTVESPSKDLQDLLMAVDFEEGKSYLVSATDDPRDPLRLHCRADPGAPGDVRRGLPG